MTYQTQCEDQPDLTIPEDTIVRAKLLQVNYKEFTFNRDGREQTGEVLDWTFEITEDGPWRGREIRGRTGAKLSNHPNNRFHAWAETLLNRDIPVGFKLDTGDLVGLPCKITVKHEPDRRDDKRIWERVDEVLPSGGFNDAPPF